MTPIPEAASRLASIIQRMLEVPNLWASTAAEYDILMSQTMLCWSTVSGNTEALTLYRKRCNIRGARPRYYHHVADVTIAQVADAWRDVWTEVSPPLNQLAEQAE